MEKHHSIKRCFRKAGFLFPAENESEDAENESENYKNYINEEGWYTFFDIFKEF